MALRSIWEVPDLLGAFDVRLVVFMDHMDAETLVNIEEVIIDVGQRFVILLQCLQQYRLGLEELLGNDGI